MPILWFPQCCPNIQADQDLFSAWPNPFANYINIEWKSDINQEIVVELQNISGTTVYRKVLYLSSKQLKLDPDWKQFPAGIYFLRVIIDDGVEVEQIIKQ